MSYLDLLNATNQQHLTWKEMFEPISSDENPKTQNKLDIYIPKGETQCFCTMEDNWKDYSWFKLRKNKDFTFLKKVETSSNDDEVDNEITQPICKFYYQTKYSAT